MKFKDWINKYTENKKYDTYTEKEILSLEVLDLSGLGIREIHPKLVEFQGEKINLSKNKIIEIPNDFVQPCTLYLSNNQIHKLPENFQQRHYLDLTNNCLETIPNSLNQEHHLILKRNHIINIPEKYQEMKMGCFLDITEQKPLTMKDKKKRFLTIFK